MKALKKILAVLSAGTMIIGGTAMTSMTASADASAVPPDLLVFLPDWVDYLEESGIPFTELVKTERNSSKLVKMCKEKDIKLSDFYEHSKFGKEVLAFAKKFGDEGGNIDTLLGSYMMGSYNMLIGDVSYGAPDLPENAEKAKELEEQGYYWTGKRWEFDSEAYLSYKRKLDNKTNIESDETPAIPGDINGDGIISVSDVVKVQKALSTSTATLDMDVNGDGKVNVFDVVAIKRMLSENLGSDVKSV